jgi:hypothetical protein
MTPGPPIPRWSVPRAAAGFAWGEIPGRPLVDAVTGGPAAQATTVRAAWSAAGLHVRFECVDHRAWGTLTRRDDPLWQEEAVEVFLAPGTADPVDYLEFEVSPRGVLWDGRIHNPTSLRADLVSDPSWDCPGVRWAAGRLGAERQDWWAELTLPWAGIGAGSNPEGREQLWRANFYRIDRPVDAPAEFTAWSPTLASPADFHRPARFGVLELAQDGPGPGSGSASGSASGSP